MEKPGLEHPRTQGYTLTSLIGTQVSTFIETIGTDINSNSCQVSLHCAEIDPQTFLPYLGAEGSALGFRHIFTFRFLRNSKANEWKPHTTLISVPAVIVYPDFFKSRQGSKARLHTELSICEVFWFCTFPCLENISGSCSCQLFALAPTVRGCHQLWQFESCRASTAAPSTIAGLVCYPMNGTI